MNENSKATKVSVNSVFTLAWVFVKSNGFSKSDALKTAWANEKLRAALHNGVCEFRFRKVDGSIRQAFGTLQADKIPQTGDSGRRPNPTLQTYFDLEKGEWRCYKKCNLL